MRRNDRKLNNQGSTLITVMICIAFIGILGSMMLSVTMTNLQMKIIESKSKENFYSCEVVMEEIRTGIEELASNQIQTVYETQIIKNFAGYLSITDEAARNIYIKKMVGAGIIRQIGVTGGLSDEQLTSGVAVKAQGDDIFNGYLSVPPADVILTVTIGTGAADTPIYSLTGDTVVIKDISVRMRMTRNDYETSITSDIVITLPDFTFDHGTERTVYRMDPPFTDYALVADGRIRSDHASGENTVNGNAYAGTGITVDGQNMGSHALKMNSAAIITRGMIEAEDSGKLIIRGVGSRPSVIWADSLITNRTPDASSANATTLDIYGICFIKDDLTLEGSNSLVNITGAYVGYTGLHTAKGSSIIINGSGSSLNLSGLDSLILAGRANVSVIDVLRESDIMTGESVAIKSNQRAYLIPGRFISDINHNPITVTDIEGYDIPQVDFSTIGPSDIMYTDYVDPSHPFKIASKQTVTGDAASLLRYYYLDFASGKQADAFLQEYISKNPTTLSVMEPFRLGTVTLPDRHTKEVITAGNRMSYDGFTVSLEAGMSNLYPTDPAAVNPDIELDGHISGRKLENAVYTVDAGLPAYEVGMLGGLYSKISHLLSLDSTRAYQEADKTVKSVVIPDGVDFIGSRYADDPDIGYYSGNKTLNSADIDPDSASFVVVNGDAVLNTNFNGLLVASGNIVIGNNVTINGMVVSVGSDASEAATGGNITVGDNVTVNGRLVAVGDITLGIGDTFNAANPEAVTEIFEKHGEILRNLFKYTAMSINFTIEEQAAESTVNLSAMISYENWRKN